MTFIIIVMIEKLIKNKSRMEFFKRECDIVSRVGVEDRTLIAVLKLTWSTEQSTEAFYNNPDTCCKEKQQQQQQQSQRV